MKIINRLKNKVRKNSKYLSFYMAIMSMFVNMLTPFLLSYSYVAYAEDTSAPVTEEVTVEEESSSEENTSSESSSEESVSEETSSEESTTEESSSEEESVTTEEPSSEAQSSEAVTAEESQTSETAGVENITVENVDATNTQEVTSGSEPTEEVLPAETVPTENTTDVSVTSEPQGDILDTGASDYRPEEEVPTGVEEPTTDTTDATDPVIFSSELAEEAVEAVEEPRVIEQECLTDGQEITDSSKEEWNVDSENGYAETANKVKLGVKYIFPEDEKVTVTFTCLPKNEEDRSILKIQKVKVSDLNLPDEVSTSAEYAYDITTDMDNGNFKYDVTLPKPEGVEAKVSYIEKSIEEATGAEIKSDEVKAVEEDKLDQDSDGEDVRVSDLDHFTIYIATYADYDFSVTESSYLKGDTVYIKAGELKNNKWYRILIDVPGPGGENFLPGACNDGSVSSTVTSDYTIPSSGPTGTWVVELHEFNNSSDCTGANVSHPATKSVNFNVVDYTTPVANPSLSQACGLDIALVLDVSGSIDSSELTQMKNAFKSFVDALNGTPTQFSVTKFDTTASVLQGFTSDFSLVKTKIDAASGGNYTNWQDGLIKSRSTFDPRADKPNLVIFASDGNPNRVGSGTMANETTAVNAAVGEANTAKSNSIRILTLGIGDELSIENLKAISGHNVNTGSVLTSDVITTDFSGLSAQLATFAKQTCGGKISVNKYVDGTQKSDGKTWSFKIDGTTTITTDSNGQVASGTLSVGNHSISEVSVPSGYSYDHATCTSGTVDPTNQGYKDIAVTADSIITCNFYNTTNRGSITIIEDTIPNDAQDFSFTTTGNGLSNFSLDDDSDATLPNIKVFTNLMPGTYGVAVGSAANWNLTSAVCSDGSSVDSISLQAGENITCTFTNTYAAVCGDGTVNQASEECDLGAVNGDVCTAGYGSTCTYCSASCKNVTVTGPYCGDSSINGSETCDAGSANGVACTPNYGSTCNYCSSTCTTATVTGPYCGDGFKNGTEACDDGNSVNTDACLNSCTLPVCGDGYVYSGVEECDKGASNESTCTPAYGSSCSYCDAVACTNETITGPYCGDGIKNDVSEACDGADLGGLSSTDFSCTNKCALELIEPKVTICHATDSQTNPYNTEKPNKSADVSGHDGHNGVIWYPGITVEWGDIIPPFAYTGGTYAGKNWTTEGQTIWNNGCSMPTGSLQVNKEVDTNADGIYKTPSTDLGFRWSYTGDTTEREMGSSVSIPYGNYSVSEKDVSNYHFTGWYSKDSGHTCANPEGTSYPISVKVSKTDADASVITLCNAVDTGTITIKKDVIPNSSDTFAFTLTDAGSYTESFNIGDNGSVKRTLPVGGYAIDETANPMYSTSVNCGSEGSNPSGGFVRLDLSKGENIVCNYVNTKKATIIVEKQTLPDGDPKTFTFLGDLNGSIADGSQLSANVSAGTYTVTENAESGWGLKDLSCNDSTHPSGHRSTVNKEGRSVTFKVIAGETVKCTFTNEKYAQIVVQKTTNPAGDLTAFSIRLNGGTTGSVIGTRDGVIKDDLDKTYEVKPGTYSVNETVPSGWAKTSDNCSGITVSAGETKYCEIVNTKTGSITITKNTFPANNSQNFTFDISFDGGRFDLDGTAGGPTPKTKTFTGLLPGKYWVSERSNPDWTLTGLNCVGGTSTIDGSRADLTLGAGESITCTYENTKHGSISGFKFNDRDGDNTWDTLLAGEGRLNGWRIFVDEGDKNQKYDLGEKFSITDGWLFVPLGTYSINHLMPGTYQICEEMQEGWYSSMNESAVCKTITIEAGENKDMINFGNHEALKVIAQKVVCDKESDLPNWGADTRTRREINSNTAQDWVNSHSDSCRIVNDWEFEWGQENAGNPGDRLIGHGGTGWNLFGPSTSGKAEVSIDKITGGRLEFREVLQEDYIPFTYGDNNNNSNNVSAEFYCSDDVANYDNWDFVNNPKFGSTYYCVGFNALNKGNVTVYKFNDLNENGVRDSDEPLLSDWDIIMGKIGGDSLTQQTKEGETSFELIPGDYILSENIQRGWYQTAITCETEGEEPEETGIGLCHWNEGADKWNALAISINNPGHSGHENDYPYEGPVDDKGHPTKAGDQWCEDNDPRDQEGPLEARGLVTVAEPIENSYPITLKPSDEVTCYIGNRMINPVLHISKENDTGGDGKKIGDIVEFTIKVWTTEFSLNNVRVVDLLPKGFKYMTGSWKAYDYNNDLLSIIEPHYASPGTWEVGNLQPNKPVTLVYTAQIDDEVDAGLYKDLAWAKGKDVIDRSVLGLADEVGYVNNNFVGTEVKVDREQEPEKGKVDIEVNEEEVLGSSDVRLPATGISPFVLWSVMVAAVLGSLLLVVGGAAKLMRKRKGIYSILVLIALGVFGVAQLTVQAETTSNLVVRLEDPANPVIEAFNITFVVMDLAGDDAVNYECFKKGPSDGGFVSFETGSTIAGGDTNNCLVDESILDEDGTYYFKVEVSNGADNATSEEVSTYFDSEGPGRPKYIEKDKKSSCKNEITLKTADDGDETEYVEVYRSEDKEFTVKDSNRIKTKSLGSDEKYTFTDEFYGDDCGKKFYYGVRAFDASGNASKVRSEEITETTTIEKEGETTVETEAYLVSGSNIGTGEGSEGAEVVLEGKDGEEGGSILGKGTSEPVGALGTAIKALGSKWWILIPAILAILLIANAIRRKRAKK